MLLPLIIAGLIYFPTLFFNFTYFDDHALILEQLPSLTKTSIATAFTQDVFHQSMNQAYYRPLMTLSLMMDAKICGSSPWCYHATNIFYHLTVVLLLFWLLRCLSTDSYLLTTVFALHPVLVPAVAWIPGRNDTLLAIFFLTGFIFFLKSQARPVYLLFHFGCFILALFTKETALMLPLLCILYSVMNHLKIDLNRWATLLFGWAGCSTLWGLARSVALPHLLPISYFSLNTIPAGLLLSLSKALFPYNLSVFPVLPQTPFPFVVAAVIALIYVGILIKHSHPLGWFGIMWFTFTLGPSLLTSEPFPYFLEHRLYLPLIGLMISTATFRLNRHLLIACSIIFSLLSLARLPQFHNRISFWETAVGQSPAHPLPHRNLGAMYYLEGYPDKAVPEFQQALALNPQEPMAHNNIGLIFLDGKNYSEAEREFKAELKNYPTYDTAYYNLGLTYYQSGNYPAAADTWLAALNLNPRFPDLYPNLIHVYLDKLNATDSARAAYAKYLHLTGQ